LVASALSSIASRTALLRLLRLHLDIAVGQSVEQQVGSQLLVLVAGEVGLGRLDLAEAQLPQPVDGLLVGLRNEDGAWRVALLRLLPALAALSALTEDDLLELGRVLGYELTEEIGTL
jgi:hypothetical protein